MFYWGSGPTLGLLTLLGYLVFVSGAAFLWRQREEFSFWIDNEVTHLRRNFSRHVPAGPFYERRGESRLIVIPVSVMRTAAQLPQRRFSWGAFLLFAGVALFLLDYFL